ncbi:transporter substrate-binding protein [Effusibacillus dendaii]|uniref:Sigma-54 factor interaction domain-containing protein n=1 Tax=Effusibacillus dendaii TaxID=2743772 RepID=A0A7I8DK02_9BACL|nr:transporter substrate-binding protein [Effusibacillus dendaii]BCJ88211.1 hypothetical protein skT53_31960 [Effusibacillus dendaii]
MAREEDIKIGLLYSLTGTTGVTERGQYQSTLLAIKQINEQGGIHGRRLLPIVEDIASDPFLAARKAEKLILSDKVAVIIGLYTSVCRKMVIPILEKYNVLLLYPTLYEGEELSRNVFYLGPVPNQQLQTFIPWIIENLGKSFYLIGSDYIYPRETNRHIHRLVQSYGGRIAGEYYSLLGTQKFDHPLREIAKSKPDVVFSTVVGESQIAFYQQFYHSGVKKPIASAITAETEIQAMNPAFATGHYTSFPYFNTVRSAKNDTFCMEYLRTYGTDTISSVMESAYYSVYLLAEAIKKAKTTDTDSLRNAFSGVAFEAPQGVIKMDTHNHHLWLHSRIGRINEKGQFDILWESDGLIPPEPFVHPNIVRQKATAADENIRTQDRLGELLVKYNPLIQKLKTATRLLPYTFVVFDNNGVLLDMFINGKLGERDNWPLFSPGTVWTTDCIGQSGITLALSGHTEAIVYGTDHDIRDLHDRITVGIPIKGTTGSIQGVLGMVLHLDDFHKNHLEVLVPSLSQITEWCVEKVEHAERLQFMEKLSRDMSEWIGESLFVVRNGKILFSNEGGQSFLTRHQAFIHEYLSDLYMADTLHDEMLVRKKIQDVLYELRIVPSDDDRYIFVRKIGLDKQSVQKRGPILLEDLIGSNERFLYTIKLAKSAAQIEANILLLGESGTGKELFARAIHNESPRKNHPFVAINCGALSRELINAELFGYVEGAFTGAKKGGNPGKFEVANGGTLFLDEIGEMPLELQATLLRVLQEREVVRIGGHQPIPVDVRIIAATNKNLNHEIAYSGTFRSDLFYRLNVFTIELIPLRERVEDIPDLSDYFLAELNETSRLPAKTITDEVRQLFLTYNWPGNVRELKNVVERAFYLAANSPFITVDHLPVPIRNHSGIIPQGISSTKSLTDIKKISVEIEKQELTDLLVQFRGNISKAAKQLGISRTTLYRKLRDYQLK